MVDRATNGHRRDFLVQAYTGDWSLRAVARVLSSSLSVGIRLHRFVGCILNSNWKHPMVDSDKVDFQVGHKHTLFVEIHLSLSLQSLKFLTLVELMFYF